MTESIRSFVGIPLAPALSEQISNQLAGYKSSIDPGVIRWLVPENFHLTLQFIGQLECQLISGISQALDNLVRDVTAFEVPVTQIVCFPDAKSVVVAALAAPEKPLLQLAEQVGLALEQEGLVRDVRCFRPHITLGRIKQRPLALDHHPLNMVLTVERIALYQSISTQAGAVYSVLTDFPLKS